MAAQTWTLADLIDKIRDDLDLHAEDFVTSEEITQLINDAIDDAEEIVVDAFSDFLLTYEDLTITDAGTSVVDLPGDIYESRIRGLFYNESGYSVDNPTGAAYKLRRISLDQVSSVGTGDCYQYRLINTSAANQKLYIYPPITEASTDRFRIWYIRQFNRLTDMSDVLEKGIRPQYVFSHVKCAIMAKAGDAMLDVEAGKLLKQEDRLKNSLSRLTDDDEGFLLEPDEYSLDEAYGDDYF